MTPSQRARARGASILEFSLLGIGLIFVVLSFFEIARGMWIYQTLSYAVREGARYASVHGKDCAPPYAPNPGCQVTISQIASAIKSAGPGIDANNTTVTLTDANGSSTGDTIANLIANYTTTKWPSSTAYAPGQNVQISARYPFRTFLAMFWMGGHPLADSQVFTLGASSTETIQF